MNKLVSLKLLSARVASVLNGRVDAHEESETSTVGSREEFVMDGIKAYIESNFMKDMTLDGLAAIAGMARFRLCRAFKKRFGKSCMSYLNSVRVRNAEELLRRPDLNITEVASFVGFGSVEYFDRVFRAAPVFL